MSHVIRYIFVWYTSHVCVFYNTFSHSYEVAYMYLHSDTVFHLQINLFYSVNDPKSKIGEKTHCFNILTHDTIHIKTCMSLGECILFLHDLKNQCIICFKDFLVVNVKKIGWQILYNGKTTNRSHSLTCQFPSMWYRLLK